MELDQKLKISSNSIHTEFNYSGHTEPCGQFIGHPSEPCERCGFGYYRHIG